MFTQSYRQWECFFIHCSYRIHFLMFRNILFKQLFITLLETNTTSLVSSTLTNQLGATLKENNCFIIVSIKIHYTWVFFEHFENKSSQSLTIVIIRREYVNESNLFRIILIVSWLICSIFATSFLFSGTFKKQNS